MPGNARSEALKEAVLSGEIYSAPLDKKQKVGMLYAKKLTLNPSAVKETDIIEKRQEGFDVGAILEINQVCAFFCYSNRTVLGLRCKLDGDIIGLSPNNSDDPNDWSHS